MISPLTAGIMSKDVDDNKHRIIQDWVNSQLAESEKIIDQQILNAINEGQYHVYIYQNCLPYPNGKKHLWNKPLPTIDAMNWQYFLLGKMMDIYKTAGYGVLGPYCGRNTGYELRWKAPICLNQPSQP